VQHVISSIPPKFPINSFHFRYTESAFASISTPQYAIVIVHGILLVHPIKFQFIIPHIQLNRPFSPFWPCSRHALPFWRLHVFENVSQKGRRKLWNCECKTGKEKITQYFWEMYIFAIRFLALLHSFWSICLLCLLVFGLSNLPWNGDYIGGDLLWLAIIVFSAGLFHSSNRRSFPQKWHPFLATFFFSNSTVIKFVLNAISLAFCVEKALLSIWLVFQSATHPDYTNEAVFDRRSRIGQIVLHGTQFFVLSAESVTALCGTIIYGNAIRARGNIERRGTNSMGRDSILGGRIYFHAQPI
jgi:hypothetical protein